MKKILFFLICSLMIFSACTSESATDNKNVIKKKGEEDPLIERYMKDMVANPTSQDEIDRNLIVNLLIDSLWDFQKTASGIYYNIETPGTGGHPDLTSNIIAHYRGTLLDGTKFDASYDRNEPLNFTLREVIAGWQVAIPMLQKGGKGTFIVPSKLAYGSKGFGNIIKKNSVLIFEMELLDFH